MSEETMDFLGEDRSAELENTIANIVQDAHNKAVNECHHLILGFFDKAKSKEYKNIYSELEKHIVDIYKQRTH